MEKKEFLSRISQVTTNSSNIKAIQKSAEDIANLVSELDFKIECTPVESERHYFDVLDNYGRVVGSVFASQDQINMFIKTNNFYFTASTTGSDRVCEYQNLHAITSDYALEITENHNNRNIPEENLLYADEQSIASSLVYTREHFNKNADVCMLDVIGHKFYPHIPYEYHASCQQTWHGNFETKIESIEKHISVLKTAKIYSSETEALSKIPTVNFAVAKKQDRDEILFFGINFSHNSTSNESVSNQ